MSLTPSNMVPLGTRAPFFKIKDVVSGQLTTLPDEKMVVGVVVMFICNHCPYVKHVLPEIVRISEQYRSKDIDFIAISSNDIEGYPADNPDEMVKLARKWNFSFPYLFDETQEVAKAYDAACTPDFYVYNSDLSLVYRGQLDDSRPGNEQPLDGKDLRKAIEDMLNKVPVSEAQLPSQGCNIKWK